MATTHLRLFALAHLGGSNNNIRTIKVIFKTEAEARPVIENFNRDIIPVAADKEVGDIDVTRDRTVAKRKLLGALRNYLF